MEKVRNKVCTLILIIKKEKEKEKQIDR